MKITVLTLFPEMFEGPMNASILKKAREKDLIAFDTVNFRDYAHSKHKNVDDIPYGGGAGMVLKPEPIFEALEDVRRLPSMNQAKVLLMSPQGQPFNQAKAQALAQEEALIFLCGHYEGFDERIRTIVDEELSIGDYVLTGGELPAMVVIDAVCRLLPGVLGEKDSHVRDSFSDGLLEHPHYTRPREYRGMTVPEVLLNGHHAQIDRWRRKESLRRTWHRRKGLLEAANLSPADQLLLKEIRQEDKSSVPLGERKEP